jgi:hypothetical protein
MREPLNNSGERRVSRSAVLRRSERNTLFVSLAPTKQADSGAMREPLNKTS